MTDNVILDIRGLSKTYKGGLRALDNIDLQIRKGEIFALLGPNGAGKTTLIGAICGLVRPSSGSIHAFGLDLAKSWRQSRARIGLVPQELATDMFETVRHSVGFSRGLFGLPKSEERIEEVLRSLSLWDKRDEPIRALSGGMKRRVLIAKALSHDPDLLFLDEPTAGLDPIGAAGFDRLIRELTDILGLTVFLITHDLDTLYEICDRVAVIADRNVIAVGTIDELLAQEHPWIQEYFNGPRGRAAKASQLRSKPMDSHGNSVD